VGISPVTPIPDLREKLNRFIAECRADGTLDDMYERWVLRGEQTMPDIPPAENPSFTLRVGTTGSVMPYSYYVGTELAGYDIELAHRFAAWLGAKLEFKVFDFGGIIAAAEAGRIDCIMSNLYYSEERDKSIPFSDVLFEVEITAMVRDEKQDSQSALPGGFAASAAGDRQETFWDGIKSSFDKTFIRENRWKLFADGVLTTLLITVLSILFGTLLGFLVFMLCRNGNIVANGVTRFCIWLVHGMPTVVLLMVLYYIVFGSVAINGIAVAVLGFTLTFGASVFGLLKLGVGTIDRGQYEAAYALGHSNRHTFFRIILPQAIPHILPAYQGEIAGLIKATAIVGYIAVQDLTKMGDIVRSRTYEAFFPLIAITIIYFVLEGLFSLAVSRISISIDPRKRKRDRILKGVNTHD
jgi:polar amino acid transport system substrate-binding protein